MYFIINVTYKLLLFSNSISFHQKLFLDTYSNIIHFPPWLYRSVKICWLSHFPNTILCLMWYLQIYVLLFLSFFSSKLIIVISASPQLIVYPQNIKANIGDYVNLSCISSIIDITPTWYFNGIPVQFAVSINPCKYIYMVFEKKLLNKSCLLSYFLTFN